MNRTRLALILLNVGGALMLLGAALDLSLSRPPEGWAQVLGGPVTQLAAPVSRLLLALVHALGSSLLAGAITTLLLVNGPVRRGDRAAAVAVAVVAIVGEGGNGLQMVLAGLAYGWGVLIFITPVLLGLLVAYLPTPAFSVAAGRVRS